MALPQSQISWHGRSVATVRGTPYNGAVSGFKEGNLGLLMPQASSLISSIRYTTPAGEAPYGDPDPQVISDLLRQGCDVNGKNELGESPLMAAVERCYLDTVRLLLDRGADVNAADRNGRTALMRAVEASAGRGMRPTVAASILPLLLARGANASDKDIRGQTALSQLIGRTLSDIDAHNVSLLLDAIVPSRSLLTSFLTTCTNSFSASWVSETKTTKEIHAVILDLLQDLVRRGAEVNTSDERGWTPLMRVIKLGACGFNAAEVLLGAGADINAKAGDGTTVCSAYMRDRAWNYGGEWKAVALSAEETHEAFAVLNFLARHGCAEAVELLSENNKRRLENKRQLEQFLKEKERIQLENERIRRVQSDRAVRKLCVMCGGPLSFSDRILKRTQHKRCVRFQDVSN